MNRPKKSHPILLALLLLVLPSCALMGRGEEGENDMSIRVENNLIPPTTLSVYAIPEVGGRQLAGVVRPGETVTLSFPARSTDSYRFAAETTAGREIVSNTLTLGPGESAVWDVNANTLVRGDGRS